MMPSALQFEKDIAIDEGRRLRIRPIRADDALALVEMGKHSTTDDLRLRFFSAIRPVPGPLASALAENDFVRQMAVAAFDPDVAGAFDEFLGVVRLNCAPDGLTGEFAIMVRSDVKGHGLGHALMLEMLGWATDRGLTEVGGDVLPENRPMLHVVRSLGGIIRPHGHDFKTVRVAFDLPLPV